MISKGYSTIRIDELRLKISDSNVAARYLGITKIPCVINSPLRKDERPSFGLYSNDGNYILYRDFSTGETGDLYDLLSQMWGIPINKAVLRVYEDFKDNFRKDIDCRASNNNVKVVKMCKGSSKISVKVREWRQYDIDYWKSYGVSLDTLIKANVYPISNKIITKENKRFTFGADKYAYAFIEKKEGNLSIKVYQPYNKNGFKWSTSTDGSVISLWTMLPDKGDKVCICSSLKDALCLYDNCKIPSIALQGEGYLMSDTAVNELKRRFDKVYIMFDVDKAGIEDSKKLAKLTGFINLRLPDFNKAKDISDAYKSLGDNEKDSFRIAVCNLFN